MGTTNRRTPQCVAPSPLPIVQESSTPTFLAKAAKLLRGKRTVEEVLQLVWDNGYNKGLSHMDKMHGQL